MNRQTHSSRRRAGPHIPSNLRIRRPRNQLHEAIVASDDLPLEGDNDRSIFEQQNHTANQDALARQAQSSHLRPVYDNSRRRPSSRRLGAVEALAMNDRMEAAANRNATSSALSDGSESEHADTSNSRGDRINDSSSSSSSLASPSAGPRVNTKVSRGNDLPALAEVSSPAEASYTADGQQWTLMSSAGTESGNGNENAKSAQQTQERDVQPSTQTLSRPQITSTASAPPEELPAPLIHGAQASLPLDDTLVPSSRKGLERIVDEEEEMHTPASEGMSSTDDSSHHAAEVADYLDVIDAEVGTLSYLTNVQNSIFVPNIPFLYDRRPVHELPRTRRRGNTLSSIAARAGRRESNAESEGQTSERRASHDRHSLTSDLEQGRPGSASGAAANKRAAQRPASVLRRISSYVPGRKKEDETYELAQHIKEWDGMDDEERNELDEHVQLVLSRRSKIRRGAKGFWAFVKTPMGFIMTLYGFLITFWGTAIMLFIFSWIHVGQRRRYWIEICDQILCALFAAVGLGFAPFRAVDTYRMIWIAKMHYRTWERRKKLGLTDLQDPNDLPRPEGDRSNQISRIITANRSAKNKDEALPSRARQASADEGTDVEKEAGQTKAEAKGRRKHWWSLRRTLVEVEEEKPSRLDNLLGPVRPYSKSSKKKGQFVVPEREQTFSSTGQTGEGDAHGHPPLKRNDSIKSELVKEREDIVVLTQEEQALLEHHQRKFHASHTFYRFHETATHRAFPLDLMITITCLLDCHSLLQGALGGCTWGIKYTHRPTVLTATLITCSLSCNAMAGLLIYIGGRKTKKREEVERRLRIALEAMALAKIERRRARGELPARSHEKLQGGADSSSNKDTQPKGSESSEDGDVHDTPSPNELGQAVDLAARQTEEEDQRSTDSFDAPFVVAKGNKDNVLEKDFAGK